MLKLDFAMGKGRTLKVLCIGAHSDDIEIGCGGTVLRLLAEYGNTEVHWVVLGSSGQRDGEAAESAKKFLAGAGKIKITIKNFRDGFFPHGGGEVKDFFEEMKKEASPDVIFTHCRNDLHQDHRLVSELTWNTYRDHLILEYEVVKYDGDLGAPNFFVHLDEETCKRKIDIMMESFRTQASKDWFTPDTFLSMMRIRGVESRAPEKYAEGFYCRKSVL